jgi:cytochrome c oxidase subunit 2
MSSRARRIGLGATALVPVSLAVNLLLAPSAMAACCSVSTGASPNARSIHSLYNIIFYIAIVVFLAVVSVLLYSVYKFRASKHPVASQIHGNTRLEIGLTISAALILVVLATVTFIKLPGIINPPDSEANASAVLSASLTSPNPPNGQKVTICVTGRQFIWRYTYGANCNKSAWAQRLPYSYQEMVAPAGVTVDLVIQSSDVVHSWWVPALGGKVDAVPGFTTYTWFRADKANELYHGQCAQLCGRQHAFMTALVKIVTPQHYAAWLTQQSKEINQQNEQLTQIREQLIKQGDLTSSGTF